MKTILIFMAVLLVSALACGACAENVTAKGNLGNSVSLYNEAIDLANAGDYDNALIKLDSAVSVNENFSLAYAAKSGVLVATGDYESAVLSAKKAVAINPGQADAWVNMATAYIALGRYSEGLSASESAIELNPSDTGTLLNAWLNKGTALGGLGRYEEEIEASEKAIAIDPQDNRAWANKNYAKMMLENEAQASPMSGFAALAGIFAVFALLNRKKERFS